MSLEDLEEKLAKLEKQKKALINSRTEYKAFRAKIVNAISGTEKSLSEMNSTKSSFDDAYISTEATKKSKELEGYVEDIETVEKDLNNILSKIDAKIEEINASIKSVEEEIEYVEQRIAEYEEEEEDDDDDDYIV